MVILSFGRSWRCSHITAGLHQTFPTMHAAARGCRTGVSIRELGHPLSEERRARREWAMLAGQRGRANFLSVPVGSRCRNRLIHSYRVEAWAEVEVLARRQAVEPALGFTAIDRTWSATHPRWECHVRQLAQRPAACGPQDRASAQTTCITQVSGGFTRLFGSVSTANSGPFCSGTDSRADSAVGCGMPRLVAARGRFVRSAIGRR